jgi:preprotein translocase subunit SecF
VIQLPTEGRLAELRFALEEEFGPIDEVRQEANIGPVISGELAQQALLLIVVGSIGILGWMTFRFNDFRMGMTAIAALLHDVVVVVGIFAIGGTFFGLQVDALFVTAMLTVIGFSVHDTIVVFDRVRENRVRHAGEPFAAIVNHSLLQTLGRSLNTSLTTVLVLTALLLFGSEATRAFVFAMVIGIISGTYSSIFNASALLVTWHEWSERRRHARDLALARSR